MKILYLSHRIPYPPNKGDKIRTFHQVKYLSKDNELYIATLCDTKNDLIYQKTLSKYSRSCFLEYIPPQKKIIALVKSILNRKPISVNYFYSKKLQEKINYIFSKKAFDVIFCFCSVMAEYVFKADNYLKNNPLLVMDYCDLDSHKWYQYSMDSFFPANLIYRYESKSLLEYEKRINREFSISIFISDVEKKLFLSKFVNAKNIYVIPNGIDYNFFNPNAKRIDSLPQHIKHFIKNKKIILFVGAMDYKPNIDAVLWFTKYVFSEIRKQNKDVCFLVVGRNPSIEIKKLHNENDIFVTGFVHDVRPYYDAAHIVVVPIMIARGIQNKVLEAMSMEKCVVLTNDANEGIWAEDGMHVSIANNKEGFIEALSFLLKNPKARDILGRNARTYVVDNFSWDSHLNKLTEIFKGQK